MKSKYIFGLLCLILSLSAMSVGVAEALSTEGLKISMFPVQGDSNTNIVLFVMPTLSTGPGPWRLYVYWADTCLINGKRDIVIPKTTTYKHEWIIEFNPPYGVKGRKYIVRVVVITHTGQILEQWSQFTMGETIPKLSWFDSLTQAELDAIRGPAGATGARGPAGPKGAAGATGSVGPTGASGAIGPEGPQGPAGIPGPTGADGAPGAAGADGVDGKSISPLLLYISLGMSVLSLVGVILLFARGKL